MIEALVTALPFDDSRRLTGPNPYFTATGAALESVGVAVDDTVLARWCDNIFAMRNALDWPQAACLSRPHPGGVSLAFAAPPDRLLCATEVNEWAWGAACGQPIGEAPAHPATWDIEQARHTLAALAREEASPALMALLHAAEQRQLPALLGEDLLTLGCGRHGRSYPLDALPTPDEVPWNSLAAIPAALVTGSNGKTTTVRLLSALLREQGHHTGYCCTDGLFVEGRVIDSGDYSGPIGARTVLRQPDIDAAILETARGGLLRRGLALSRANVAIVTNISADHFGEYGVHTLADLAAVKLTVARALDSHGLLVLNADDAQLREAASQLHVPIGWFSLQPDSPFLQQHAAHSPACVQRDGHLWLHPHGLSQPGHDLGRIIDMPLSAAGAARYNIANLAGAALAAFGLGIPSEKIRTVLARFGADNNDNSGRLERWNHNGVQILQDYAHNPAGLAGLLDVANSLRGNARLGVILGHAGNRLDDDLRAVAHTAARYNPDRIILKDIEGYERGRALGEIAQVMHQALLDIGIAPDKIHIISDEIAAVHNLLDWAKPGDILALPIHTPTARKALTALFAAGTGMGNGE